MLSAQVQSYGIALTVTFLALLLAAGAAAAEHDEGTIGRLRRGLVSLGQLVWAKVALAAVVGLALGARARARLRRRRRGRRRHRRRAVGAAAAAASPACCSPRRVVGAVGTLLGTLAREARTASLLAVLVVLPVVFLGLVPRGAVALAWWISEFLPFAHAVRLFGAALFDPSPWRRVGDRDRLAARPRRRVLDPGPARHAPARRLSRTLFAMSSFPDVRLRRFRRTGGAARRSCARRGSTSTRS